MRNLFGDDCFMFLTDILNFTVLESELCLQLYGNIRVYDQDMR